LLPVHACADLTPLMFRFTVVEADPNAEVLFWLEVMNLTQNVYRVTRYVTSRFACSSCLKLTGLTLPLGYSCSDIYKEAVANAARRKVQQVQRESLPQHTCVCVLKRRLSSSYAAAK